MCQPLTESTGREEYGRSVERRPCMSSLMTPEDLKGAEPLAERLRGQWRDERRQEVKSCLLFLLLGLVLLSPAIIYLLFIR